MLYNIFIQSFSPFLLLEGFTALYKGMTPPLISLTILNTINFTSYNYFRNHPWIQADRGWDYKNAIAGSFVGPIGSIVSTVENLIKTQMQVDNVMSASSSSSVSNQCNSPKSHETTQGGQERKLIGGRYKGSLHCLQTLVKERGPKILYTGHMINTTRECLFLGTYFYTYEGLRYVLHQVTTTSTNLENDTKIVWTVPVAGGLAGAWSWFVSFPLDCIRSGVQGQNLWNGSSSSQQATTSGSLHIFQNLIKSKGWIGLYSGVSPSVIRAFIVSSSRFSAYEIVVWLGGGRD
jgi:solute carrier family 25 carnitine/acylcarnitine transporter 20/29